MGPHSLSVTLKVGDLTSLSNVQGGVAQQAAASLRDLLGTSSASAQVHFLALTLGGVVFSL